MIRTQPRHPTKAKQTDRILYKKTKLTNLPFPSLTLSFYLLLCVCVSFVPGGGNSTSNNTEYRNRCTAGDLGLLCIFFRSLFSVPFGITILSSQRWKMVYIPKCRQKYFHCLLPSAQNAPGRDGRHVHIWGA